MLNKKTLDDINVSGKRVLLRCDFNVPVKAGKITDDTRITAALPTINKLVEGGAKVVLCSHFGRPKEREEEFSLKPVAERLTELLGKNVKFLKDNEVVSENVVNAVSKMENGDVALLENTRFRKEETKNDKNFSKELASLADVFVIDAFGSSHRAHCSTVGVTEFLDTSAVGYLMQKEIEFLGNAVNDPKRPFAAILGGVKVSDKIDVITNFLEKVDVLIIGGGMAYTFIKAMGYEIGKSLLEEDKVDYAKELMEKAKVKGVKLLLPVDTVIADEFKEDANFKTVDIDKMEEGWLGVDIGEKTMKLYADALKDAKTVVWNGPMGVFEMDNFAKGTKAVAEVLANIDATTIIGGGDSAAAVIGMGYKDKMTHISTGGGASLEFLEGKPLPGVEAVQDK
ncbi:MAG: phosphoglycerate kinase [Defluviitaleaceae bacterium]|nr:phosphoglycerate kinase [Defluviitaleaceae bacterium]